MVGDRAPDGTDDWLDDGDDHRHDSRGHRRDHLPGHGHGRGQRIPGADGNGNVYHHDHAAYPDDQSGPARDHCVGDINRITGPFALAKADSVLARVNAQLAVRGAPAARAARMTT